MAEFLKSTLWDTALTVEDKSSVKKQLTKINNPKSYNVVSAVNSKSLDISTKLELIAEDVHRILGVYEENTQVIKTKDDFIAFIDIAISNGVVAVDTETNNSLDPITCKLMGLCLYTVGQKNAYIPINHTDLRGERLSWQLTESDVAEQLGRLSDTKIVMHNGKFDYQVIKCTCGIALHITWDTLIGAKLLDENEQAGLKWQYINKIDPSIEKYDIEHLFKKIEYNYVAPELFALYAATDAFMTYKLYEYQLSQFSIPSNADIYKLFLDVEMPMVIVTAELELTGICIDTEYAQKLLDKYNVMLKDIKDSISKELHSYDDKISAWRLTPEANVHPKAKSKSGIGKSKNEQLDDPVSTTSPSQLAILLYDVLKLPSYNSKSPRSTDEETLGKIYSKHKIPLCNLILEQRGLEKLISTYINKLPNCINPTTGRLHAKFNQAGAATGRLSSSEPNLQNIPSHNKEIRLMFVPSKGCLFVGADFSQQEPRLFANFCQDENMVNAYMHNKDLYATMAAGVYHNNYEDNKEFHPDGSLNPEGKKRRSNCKSLLLGLMYGRGIASIAEQLHCSIEEAQQISDNFFESFPKAKSWMDNCVSEAKVNGYVLDLWGRKRRLPDIQLPRYSIVKSVNAPAVNPLLDCKGIITKTNTKDAEWLNKLNACRGYREAQEIIAKARNSGVVIRNNGAFIAQAERQCINARIQGSAATQSKKAMIAVYNSTELKDLGFKLLLPVHDELIGECPIENVEEAGKILSALMRESGKPECQVPMKCDVSVVARWYEDDFSAEIQSTFENMVSDGMDEISAENEIIKNNPMISVDYLREMMHGTYQCAVHERIC